MLKAHMKRKKVKLEKSTKNRKLKGVELRIKIMQSWKYKAPFSSSNNF